MSQAAAQQPSRKKAVISLLVLLALTCIIVFTFKDHWAEITAALAQLSVWQVLAVLAVGISYPLLEGCVAWVIVRSRLPQFTLRQGLDVGWCGTFGNVVTLGAGAVPVQLYYLHKAGLPLGPGAGLMTLEYVFHKSTVLLYATVMLLLQHRWLAANTTGVMRYLPMAYAVVAAIIVVLVLVCGAELFTGNSLMVCALKSKKITLAQMLKAWVVVWVGNFVGALFIVFLVYMAGIYKLNGEAVANSMVSVAAGKVTIDWVTIFFRGILCNIFVCLAVWIGTAGKTVVDKVVGILLPIAAFVACGFEHCVANMYFLPMGAVMHACGYGADVAGADALNVAGIAFNLSAATLGNIVGGAVLIALGYWFIYAKKSEA